MSGVGGAPPHHLFGRRGTGKEKPTVTLEDKKSFGA